MRRLSLVTIALLLLLASSAAWAAGPAGSTRVERPSLDFKALLGQLSEVFSKMFAAEGPSIDPLGRKTADEGPDVDPLGRATGETGPVIDPWGGAASDNGPRVDPWG